MASVDWSQKFQHRSRLDNTSWTLTIENMVVDLHIRGRCDTSQHRKTLK